MEEEKKRCPECGGEMKEVSLLRFGLSPKNGLTVEKSPPIGLRCEACGYIEGSVLAELRKRKIALPDDQNRFSLLEIEEEECPKGGKHKIKTETETLESVAFCEKCGQRWIVR
jgi:uncharacterized Zn finger protein